MRASPASVVTVWLAAVLAFCLARSARSQPLGTDVFAGAQLVAGGGVLLRVDSSGIVTTVMRLPAGQVPEAITVDGDNRSFVVAITDQYQVADRVVRLDATTGQVLATLWRSRCDGIRLNQDGDYWVLTPAGLFTLARNGTTLTTIVTRSRNLSFVEDKSSGDWIIGEVWALPGWIHRIDRDTHAPITAMLMPMAGHGPISMAQDPHRPDIYLPGSPFIRFDPVGQTVTPVGNGGLRPTALVYDRAPDTRGGLIHASAAAAPANLVVFTRNGVSLRGWPLPGTTIVTDLCLDRSRNLAPRLVSAPNHRTIAVSFPGDAGKPFLLALGLSGYAPGVTLPDGRVIPLNPDPLTALTLGRPLPPLLTGNTGRLSATATGAVTFDANPLGAAVRGVRVWAVALTLDASAPLGVSQISAPILFVL